MDTQVVTRDTRRCCRNTCRAAHKYSIKMQVEAAKNRILSSFYPGEYL